MHSDLTAPTSIFDRVASSICCDTSMLARFCIVAWGGRAGGKAVPLSGDSKSKTQRMLFSRWDRPIISTGRLGVAFALHNSRAGGHLMSRY